MKSVVALPMSRLNIREVTLSLRKMTQYDKNPWFPIVHFIEFYLPQMFPDFVLRIKDQEEMGDCHGIARPQQNTIDVREDIYLRAADGKGRDRFTLAHELGHFLLHSPSRVGYARGNNIPTFQDPEWQANVFAGELLIPKILVEHMDAETISKICQVSRQAAAVQLSHYRIAKNVGG